MCEMVGQDHLGGDQDLANAEIDSLSRRQHIDRRIRQTGQFCANKLLLQVIQQHTLATFGLNRAQTHGLHPFIDLVQIIVDSPAGDLEGERNFRNRNHPFLVDQKVQDLAATAVQNSFHPSSSFGYQFEQNQK